MQAVSLLLLIQVGISLAHILPLPNRTKFLSRPAWPGTCDGSDSTHTQNCLDNFFKGLGFSLPKDTAPAFIDYAKKLSTLVQQYGDDGIDIYCDYEATLETCLGNLINTPCVDAESFSLMYFDLGTADSIEYAINIPSGAYECKNKDLLKQYRGCYKDTDVNHVEEFVQCSLQLQSEEVGVVGSDRCGYSCNLEEIKLGVDASACKGKLPDCTA